MFVFLMCTERSGSNLLTSLAGALPEVSAPPPTHLFRLFANNAARYGDLDVDTNWRALLADVVANFEAKLGIWHIGVDEQELAGAAMRRHPFELLRVIYAKEAEAEHARHSFVKENHTHAFASMLIEVFEDCRFVFMVRDPRDVAASWVRTDSIPGGVEKAVDTWLGDQAGSLAFISTLQDAALVHRLHYETLIASPEAELERLATFMGVTFSPSALEGHERPHVKANAARIEAWRNIARPVMRDNAGTFGDVLSEADVRYIELTCADLMAELGYRASTRELGEAVAPAEIERLRPTLSTGRHVVDDDEAAIRRGRLLAMRRVLDRRST